MVMDVPTGGLVRSVFTPGTNKVVLGLRIEHDSRSRID